MSAARRRVAALAAAGLLSALVAPGAARADVVHLLDGSDPIEGKIVSENAFSVVVQLEKGQLTLNRTQIERIERKPWKPRSATPAPATPPAAPPSTGSSSGAPSAGTPAGGSTGSSTAGAGAGSAVAVSGDAGAALAEGRAAIVAARPRGAQAVSEAVSALDGRLLALEEASVPALAEALGGERDADVAGSIERALQSQAPSSVPGRPLVSGLQRAGFDALAPLARQTGRCGGADGAKALAALLDQGARVERELAGKPEDADLRRQMAAFLQFKPTIVESLSLSGEVQAGERLLDIAGGSGGPEVGAARLGLVRVIARALEEAQDRDAVKRLIDAALTRLPPDAVGPVLSGLGQTHKPEALDALARAVRQVQGMEVGSPGRQARLTAAMGGLSCFLRTSDNPAEPAAVEAFLGLTSDEDETIRAYAVSSLGTGGGGTQAVVSMLIDRYERDPSQAVVLQAHGALVMLADGQNQGDPEAWRAWARQRSVGQ